MGFFDEVSKQEGEKQSLEKTEQVVKELFQKYLTDLKRLQRTSAYSSALMEEKEKAFSSFKDYFSSRGFNINPSIFSNVEGFVAIIGDFEAELIYQGSNRFTFTIKGILNEGLNFEDKKANPRNFQGHVSNNEIIMTQNVLEEDKLSIYLKATEDIQKDIADTEELIRQNYKPDLHLYLNNTKIYVKDINEYFNLLNEQLKY